MCLMYWILTCYFVFKLFSFPYCAILIISTLANDKFIVQFFLADLGEFWCAELKFFIGFAQSSQLFFIYHHMMFFTFFFTRTGIFYLYEAKFFPISLNKWILKSLHVPNFYELEFFVLCWDNSLGSPSTCAFCAFGTVGTKLSITGRGLYGRNWHLAEQGTS